MPINQLSNELIQQIKNEIITELRQKPTKQNDYYLKVNPIKQKYHNQLQQITKVGNIWEYLLRIACLKTGYKTTFRIPADKMDEFCMILEQECLFILEKWS